MIRSLRGVAASVTLIAMLMPYPALAQQPAPAVADSVHTLPPAERGHWDGMLAARGISTAGWLATGLLSGLVAGPVGAGINFAVASARDTPFPPDSLLHQSPVARSGEYREAFTDAYRARIRSNRRTAALVGGLTGTAIFAFVILQVVNWDAGSGSAGGGGGGGELP